MTPPSDPSAAVPVQENPVDAAPTWRRQPYRIFFPLGWILLLAGVSPWLFVAIQTSGHPSVFHSITQIQGFLLCFAVGFLFTLVPRRTGTPAPGPVLMMVGIVCPIGTTVAAADRALAWSQAFWFLLVAVLGGFVLGRFRRAGSEKRLPGWVWVPIALGFGVVGSVLFGVYGALGREYFRVHELAKLFLLQGLFLGLILGVGGTVLPLLLRGEAVPARVPGARWGALVHLLGAAGLCGSFFLEVYGSGPWGRFARAGICAIWLVGVGGIHRFPTLPGGNRWLLFAGAWCIPAGFLVAGAFPGQVQAGLHLVFLGGFTNLALATGAHVTLAHGGRKAELEGWPWQVVGFALMVPAAIVARGLMLFQPAHYWVWLGVAAGCALVAALCWAAWVFPRLRSKSVA